MKGRKPTPVPTDQVLQADPPAGMCDRAAAHWRKLVSLLSARRVLANEDLPALSILASSLALYEQAQASIDTDGPVGVGANGGLVKSPWVTLQNQAWDRIRPLLSEFGLSPTARARLKPEDPADGDADFF